MGQDWGSTVEFKAGDPRTVTACFRAGKNGKIPYALGPENTLMMKVRDRNMPIRYSELIYGGQFSYEVTNYMDERVSNFKFTREEIRLIGDAQWKISLIHFCHRAMDAFPWVAGLIIGIGAVSAGIGWMVRGFAGVLSGQDFKSDERNQAARRNRASVEWIWSGLGGWGIVAGIAWVVTKLIDPAAPTGILGKYTSKIVHAVGMIVIALIGFGLFFGGGVALRGLVYAILNRKRAEMKTDDKTWLGFSFANGGIVLAGSWLLGNYTVVGDWSDAVYRWGFANGMQDGPQVAICGLFLLWPIVPLVVISHRRRKIEVDAQELALDTDS